MVGGEGGDNTQTTFGDMEKNASITIAETGLSEEGAIGLMQTVLGAAGSILDANNDRWATVADQQAQAVSDIAKSATGTESEVGRLVNKFGLPVLLGLAATFGIGWIIHTVKGMK